MESHGDLILELYGRARGRASEYWGEEHLDSDRWMRTVGVPGRGEEWAAGQPAEFAPNLRAFARGMNAYAEAHPERLADHLEVVLPITEADVMAHTNAVLHFTFVTNAAVTRQAVAALGSEDLAAGPVDPGPDRRLGSNAWAIGPSRSASGNALLVANPHLPWEDLFLFWESHMVTPTADAYGVTLVGIPGIAIGFNQALGWTHTVNTIDGADLFAVEVQGDGYRFGDEVLEFEARTETLRVLQDDGSLREEALEIRSTVHGPVLAADGSRAVALRVAGLDDAATDAQWWDMARATTLAEFEEALSGLHIPMFNVVYADRDGRILYLFGGRVPVRSHGEVGTWAGVVDGSDPGTLWTEYLSYEELPRLVDPAVGWVQNANDPPWTSTVPQSLDADEFPAWVAPRFMHWRAQRSARMLLDDPSITFEEAVAYKHSSRMESADRILPSLLDAARASGRADVEEAATVLEAWSERPTADVGQGGGVLYETWLFAWLRSGGQFAEPWSQDEPASTPRGLADPEAAVEALARAATQVREIWGDLAVPWGEVHNARVGEHTVPVSGANGDPAGVFRVTWYGGTEDGRRYVAGGDSFYAVVEFTPEGPRAQVLLAYGNATQSHSAHVGDQLDLFGQNRMRTPWLTRADVEANLEGRTGLGGAPR
jgi:acyl-homoserine-lactone acylase